MAAEEDKKVGGKPINDDQRFRYIGFEVFPGKPKDLFKSAAEKDKFVKVVVDKRDKGDLLREGCTLLEERVSFLDRLVMTVASVVIFLTLFIPWYAAYNEIVEETQVAVEEPVVSDSTMLAQAGDSLAMLAGAGDSLAMMADAGAVEEAVTETVPSEEIAQPVAPEGDQSDQVVSSRVSSAEEVIHGYVAKKKIHKEYSRMSGLGSILALGSVGSLVFSSGGVLILTALLFLVYTLLCIGLPAYTLYGLYGLKGDADARALKLKKMVRFSWIPLIIFVAALVLSFFGAEYGFNSSEYFTSLGSSYGPAAFLGAISWGVIVSLSASILVAVKGVEI